MHRDLASNGTALWKGLGFALVLGIAACGGGGGGGSSAPPVGEETPPPPGPTATPGPDGECSQEFDGTFAGIQEVIFERQGCTQDVCHGSSAQGGLKLTADVAYANIFNKKALSSPLNLIEPGDEEQSYLWVKLAASTKPDQYGDKITGAPMPNGLPPISENDLELMRKWIYAGAPEHETVSGTDQLLDACLPPPKPITIEPLEPPAEGEGIQFELPPWQLDSGSEFEGCYATYYDVTEQTPAEKKSPDGTLFRFKGFEVRQDPQSHHLLLYYSPLNLEPGGIDVNDESFGEWTCRGGPREGQACDPKDLPSCGDGGVCTSKLVASFACAGYGPSSRRPAEIIGGAPQAQTTFIFSPGVYQQLPLKGVIYWNSHAFNLTTEGHMMHGRVNYYFAPPEDQVNQAVRISDFSAIFNPNNPPFTKETFCNDHVFPIGSRVFQLFAHTHRHGEYYWVTNAAGEMIYESRDYSDPTQARYDPPLAFDSPDRAERTVRYCAIYNNGVNEDGSPNIEHVTRASRVPASAEFIGKCSPVACVAGKIGAPCNGADDDAACDSSPGAGDGFCDACNITGGESTENEMFVLFGAQYIDPTVPGADLTVLPYQ
jgi:hypothetical protein